MVVDFAHRIIRAHRVRQPEVDGTAPNRARVQRKPCSVTRHTIGRAKRAAANIQAGCAHVVGNRPRQKRVVDVDDSVWDAVETVSHS